jgi:RNA-directed DNA polymerase
VGELKVSGKPFDISKREVWEAYQKVRANKGAPGADGVTLGDFEAGLQGNLYRIWNRMSSGSYFPPPVKAVEIPKPHGGGTRVLGVPTIADRIAQTVVAARLEEAAEPVFHPDSYGYRPGRSALDAVAACRKRCWKRDWVIDLDIRKFFDSVPWDLIVKAVEHLRPPPWAVLYVKRWLAAPLALPDGTVQARDRGTPQGSAVSPVLANLFMHYAFDTWLAREFPGVPFERYADDAVVHCVSRAQAQRVLAATADRMSQVGLALHPDKTKIVYCRDGRRRGPHPHVSFTFLGYEFRARTACARGRIYTSFLPAVSKDALKKMGRELRSWRLQHRTGHTFAQLAREINPVVRGWMQYYGAFHRSALYPLLKRINYYLARWIRRKYRRFRPWKKLIACWARICAQYPAMYCHWRWVRLWHSG